MFIRGSVGELTTPLGFFKFSFAMISREIARVKPKTGNFRLNFSFQKIFKQV